MNLSPCYTVTFYVNDRVTHVESNLTKAAAYHVAVPGEALSANAANRWHVMMFHPACNSMENLFVGETLRVCWQDYNADYDTEHILITREVFNYNNLMNQNNPNLIHVNYQNTQNAHNADGYYIRNSLNA